MNELDVFVVKLNVYKVPLPNKGETETWLYVDPGGVPVLVTN